MSHEGELLSSDFGRVCSNRCPSLPLRVADSDSDQMAAVGV